MKVLILDQFAEPSPWSLNQNPRNFEELIAEVMARSQSWMDKPQVLDVEEDFKPRMSSTVFRANANGMAEVWKYRWDSSG